MMLVPTTLREVAVNNILIVGVDMSPYNQFRLERLRRGLSNAKLALDIWESTPYFSSKAWYVARAKASVQYREYKLNSFLKHHGVAL